MRLSLAPWSQTPLNQTGCLLSQSRHALHLKVLYGGFLMLNEKQSFRGGGASVNSRIEYFILNMNI
jgi:hypothetical protein